MGTETLEGSQPKNFFGSELRDGKIYAQNMHVCVEERYPTAYNLGCGGKLWDGWINVDVTDEADLKADLRKLPILSDSADAVAAIHVVEHFVFWEVEPMLLEWKRILKPNGKMIIELPCMDKVFGYVANCVNNHNDLMPFMTLHALWGDPGHKEDGMTHRWGWFQKPLVAMLEHVGMREVKVCEPRYHFRFRDMRIEAVK